MAMCSFSLLGGMVTAAAVLSERAVAIAPAVMRQPFTNRRLEILLLDISYSSGLYWRSHEAVYR